MSNRAPRSEPHLQPQPLRRIRHRIRLQIPPQYQGEPIISNLAGRYGLEVNIQSALLGASGRESGWFDLALYGNPDRIQQALDYLSQLHIEIWAEGNESLSDWSFY
ncbi:MAG: NIL domain-containing protein [Thermosynechococcaceae cyanobacterium]